jgi:hypothetical protein
MVTLILLQDCSSSPTPKSKPKPKNLKQERRREERKKRKEEGEAALLGLSLICQQLLIISLRTTRAREEEKLWRRLV